MNELEQAVIDAARVLGCARRWEVRDWVSNRANVEALIKAIDALDESLNPDPWKLLSEVHGQGLASRPSPRLAKRIERALEWRREHGE